MSILGGFRASPFLSFTLTFCFVTTAYADTKASLNEQLSPPLGPPRFKLLTHPSFKNCLKDTANPDGYVKVQSKWELTCPIDTFLKAADKHPSKDPAFRLLIGRVLLNEILRVRQEILDPEKPKSALSEIKSDRGPQPDPDSDLDLFLASVSKKPEQGRSPTLTKNNEEQLLKRTDQLYKESQNWLKPLLEGSKKDPPILNLEAAYTQLLILGDSFRFSQVRDFLKQNSSLLLSKQSLRNEILQRVLGWVESSGNPALRDWLHEKLVSMRPTPVTGSGSQELFYWLKSIELAPQPLDKDNKSFVLRKLRELWIAHPMPQEAAAIRSLAAKLSISGDFHPPGMRDMNIKELLVRAHSQVRGLDTLGALRTMRRVRYLKASEIDTDDLWEALEYHVRVLRLLDERSQIPAVIRAYLSMGNFLDVPKDKSDRQRFLARAHSLARLYWNYDTAEKANEVLEKIISVNQSFGTENYLGPARVIQARIAEQAKDFDKAMPLFDQAISSKISQDLLLDMLWRKIFLQYDVSTKTGRPQDILPLFEPLKKYAFRDPAEKARWHYWYAETLLLNKKTSDAVSHFRDAYESDPFSYYSNMAGLELVKLKKTPKDWLLGSKDSDLAYEKRRWNTPDWESYFSEAGKLKEPQFKDLARIYFLAQIGDLRSAERAYSDLDREVWRRVLSTRISASQRTQFVRAVSWLRTSLSDPMGSLRAAEIARQASGIQFEQEDFMNLYPLPFWELIKSEASKGDVNPWLAASLIRQESAFNSNARSWANAIGLMQMIPPVAAEEARLVEIQNFKPEMLYDPPTNLKLGVHHLSRLLKSFDGSFICSIASYNAGSPPVIRWLDYYANEYPGTFIERIPYLETRNYVKSILRNFINYHRIYGDGNIDLTSLLKMPKVVPGNLVTPRKPEAS